LTYDESLELYYTAMGHTEQGKLSEAIAAIERSWSMHRHGTTAYRLSRLFEQLRQPVDVDLWAFRAFEANPQNSMIATWHAEVQLQQGRIDEARAVLDHVLKGNKCYGPALTMLRELNDRAQ
jgi:tetratricopeptide (TPR) repeat protein